MKYAWIAGALALSMAAGLLAADRTTSGPTTQPGAREVLDRLKNQGPPPASPVYVAPAPKARSSRQAAPPDAPPVTAPEAAKGGRKLLPEGYLIADRRGRLIHSGEESVFTFESDGKALADPPIVLLPNRWLEKMEADVAASTSPLVFRVSGEVTVYHGKNYLLLRKVLIEPQPGVGLIR